MQWLKKYKWLVIAVVLAFIVRLVLIHFNPRHTFLENTGIEYLAKSLAEGKGYGYDAETVTRASEYTLFWAYPPGTSALLAFIYILFGFSPVGFTYVRILQVFIDSFGCILIYLICKELFNKQVGLIAAFSYAIFLPIAFMSTWVAHDALMPFFTLCALYCFIRGTKLGVQRSAGKWYALSGLAIGVSCYFQPTSMLLPIIFGIGYFIYYIHKNNLKVLITHIKNTVKVTVTILIVVVIITLPWMIRNYYVAGIVTPMRSCGWLTVYCGFAEFGNNPEGIVLDDLRELDKARADLGYRLEWASKEYEDYYRGKAIEFVKEHPVFVLQTIAKRIPWSIVYKPELGLANYQDDPEHMTAIADGIPSNEYQQQYPQLLQLASIAKEGKLLSYIATYPKGATITFITLFYIMLPIILTGLGIWAYRKQWRILALVGTVPLYYFLVSIFILTINAKNKVPGLVGYIMLSSLAIYWISCKIKRKTIDI